MYPATSFSKGSQKRLLQEITLDLRRCIEIRRSTEAANSQLISPFTFCTYGSPGETSAFFSSSLADFRLFLDLSRGLFCSCCLSFKPCTSSLFDAQKLLNCVLGTDRLPYWGPLTDWRHSWFLGRTRSLREYILN